MPLSFNDNVTVGPPKIVSYDGVRSAMYPTTIQSCDLTQTWNLTIVEALQATTVIHPPKSVVRVRGLVVPDARAAGSNAYVDTNFGSLERFYGEVNGPMDVLVNITGTLCSRYCRGQKCLVLEADKSRPEVWYIG